MPSVYRLSTNSNATGTNVTGLNYVAGGYTFAFWANKLDVNAGDIFRQASTANVAREGYGIAFTATSLQVRHMSATQTTTYTVVTISPHRQGVWTHYAVTYDGSNARAYINGSQVSRTPAATIPTGNALCSTTMVPGLNGTFIGHLFDLQIILGGAVPGQAIPKLMDPTVVNPNLKARYFGREFVGVGAGATLRDESGNGNNLTTSATARLDIAEEPPIRPTFA